MKNNNKKTFDLLTKILNGISRLTFNTFNIFQIIQLFNIFNKLIDNYFNSKYKALFDKKSAYITFPKDIYKKIEKYNKNIEIEKSYYYCKVLFNDNIYHRRNFLYNTAYRKVDVSLQYYKPVSNDRFLNINSNVLKDSISVNNNLYDEFRCQNEILNITLNNKSDLNNLIKHTLSKYEINNTYLDIKRSINSCGIILVHGINTIFSKKTLFIDENTTKEVYHFKLILKNKYDICIQVEELDLYLELLNYIIRKSVANSYSRSSVVMFSTNIDHNNNINNINHLFEILKTDCYLNQFNTYNTNSTNNITTLILDHKKFIDKYE